MKSLLLTLKIIFGLIIGIIASIYLLQYENQLKGLISKQIKVFMHNSLSCDIEFDVKNINIFLPAVKIENVQVKPLENTADWYWHCKKISVSVSWFDILITKRVKPHIVIDNLEAYSQFVDNKLLIGPHFQKLLFSGNEQAVPVIINDLKLNKSNFVVEDKKLNIKLQVRYDCQTTEIDKVLQNRVYLNGGSISCKDITYCDNISGLVHLGILYSGEIKNFSLDGLVDLNHDNKCFFVGKWQSGANDCLIRLSTIDGKSILNLLVSGMKEADQKVRLSLRSPISTFQKILKLNTNLESDCKLNLNLDLNNLQNINGTCNFKNLHFGDNPSLGLDDIKIDFNTNAKEINSNIVIDKTGKLKLLGEFNFNLRSQIGKLSLKTLRLTGLAPGLRQGASDFALRATTDTSAGTQDDRDFNNKLYLSLICNSNLEYTGQFDCGFHQIKSKGKIKGSTKFLDVTGDLDGDKFDFKSALKPEFKINKFSLCDSKKNECFNVYSNNKTIKAILDCHNIKNWLSKYFNCLHESGSFFVAQGKLELEGVCTQSGFSGSINLNNGAVLIPEIHNIIKNIAGTIDVNIQEKKVTIKNLIIAFYKGQIECKQLVLILNDFNSPKIVKFLHAPIVVKDCFINWENVFLSNISGRLLLHKEAKKNTSITGYVSLDKSEIKDNILSNDFRKKITESSNNTSNKFLENINIDIAIFTKSPIKLRTAFFKSLINLDLRLNNLNLTGDINLLDGIIAFPYKNLKIIDASVKFLPNQINDPLINLIAKGKIKDYAITLQVMGSAQSPHILLESNPTLTEEQIISLLLIGSESSLNLVIPALLTQNIKNIVLGSAQYQDKLKKHFRQILEPLKSVRFVPTLNDYSGNKGLTATLDIEVNDRLNATVQKNFTTYEEPRVEVDYSLTDDVIVRGVKDEFGNLSGEVELRWKF